MALVQLADERLAVGAAAVGFTSTEYLTGSKSDVVEVVCRVETANVRINCKATPTAGGAEGSQLMQVDDVFVIVGYTDIKNFLAIAVGAAASLSCQFFGAP